MTRTQNHIIAKILYIVILDYYLMKNTKYENLSYYVFFLDFHDLLKWNLLCYKHANGYDISKQTNCPHNAKQNTLAPILAFHPAGCEFLLHLSSIHNWTAVEVVPLCWRSVGHCYRYFKFSWRTIHFWNFDICVFIEFLV